MATLNLSRAVGRVTSFDFIRSTALVVGGSLAATMLTDFARSNLVDISMQGGDAVYALAGAMATMAVLPSRWATPLALGMAASGGQTVLRDFNVV